MSKRHHQQNREHSTSHAATSISEEGFVLNYDEIQRRAYQIHEERGGSDLENWLEAERVLKEEHQVER